MEKQANLSSKSNRRNITKHNNGFLNSAINILRKHPYLVIGAVSVTVFETAILVGEKENVVSLSIITVLALVIFSVIQLMSDRRG